MTEAMFKEIDVDGGGTISTSEYKQYMAMKESERLGDSDREVTLEEAQAVCPGMNQQLFEEVDIDDDGTIMRSELNAFMQLRGIAQAEQEERRTADAITLDLNANFDELSVQLYAKGSPIIKAGIHNLNCAVIQRVGALSRAAFACRLFFHCVTFY